MTHNTVDIGNTSPDARALAGQAVEDLRVRWEAVANPPMIAKPRGRSAIKEDYDKNDLIEVCQQGDVPALRALVLQGVNIRENMDVAFRWAANNGHTEMVAVLLAKGANIHAENDTALGWASNNGHLETVRLLLEKGADIHANDDSALSSAAFEGRYEVALLLLEKGADIHANNDNALQTAAQSGHTEVVRLLLDWQANIHVRHDYAVRWAATNKFYETVDLLVERGAQIEGLTPDQRQAYDVYKEEQARQLSDLKKSSEAAQTLTKAFNAATWVGHVPEMAALWGQVPEALHSEFDFQSALSAVTRENVKQSITKKPRITITR
jgi:hypothetical protein